jgi:hypothetical protein
MPLLLFFLLLIPSVIHPEEPVAEPATVLAGGGRFPRIASDGRNYLVVSSEYQFYSYDHYIMLIDSAGRSLLPASITFQGIGEVADVASSGRNYLVVWGGHGGTSGALVDHDGRTTPLLIHQSTRSSLTPHDIGGQRAVTWNGSEYIVLTAVERVVMTWGWRVDTSVVATRVSETGEIVQNDIELLSAAAPFAIAAKNGVTVVVSGGDGGIQIRTLNTNWVKVNPARAKPVIAAGDDGFLIIFPAAGGISAQHLDPSGHADAPAFSITDTGGSPAVTWSRSSYLVTWSDSLNIRAMHVTGRGDRLDGPFNVASGDQPAVATNVIAWWQSPQVYAASLRENAAAQSVHRAYVPQSNPQPFWNGTAPLVAWSEQNMYVRAPGDPSGPRELVTGARLVRSVGGGPNPLHLIVQNSALKAVANSSSVLETDFTGTARGVWTGSSFIVVWSARSTLFAARLDAEGTIIDGPRQITSTLSSFDFAIAASSDKVLVSYHDALYFLRGVMLTAVGITPIEWIATPQDLPTSVSIASDGSDFLVTWICANPGHTNDYIGAQIVDASGHVVGARKILSPGNDRKEHATTFWTGSEYLVAWSRGLPSSTDLWALRTTAEGQLLDYPPVHIGALDGQITGISRAPSGQLLVAYTRGPRAYTRLISFPRLRSARH